LEKIICTVTNDLSYDQRMIRICSSLSRAGYEVVLVGRLLPSSIALRQEPFQQVRLRCRFQAGKLFYLEYNLRLLYWMARQNFDALCAVDLDTLLPAFCWSRLRGKPLVYDAHEYFTEVPEVVRRPLVQKVWEAVARFCIPRLRYAYTVGEMLAEQLEKRYGTPFHCIRNLPYRRPDLAQSIEKAQPPVILYQGALNEGRGLETALQAMTAVENAQLWLAGEGDLSTQLRDQARALQLGKNVRFLGYIPPQELQQLTPEAAIGLNLLENRGLSYYYSLANKTFDYLQAGVPAVHMAFPEYRALREQYPAFLLLDQLQPAALADCLNRLLKNPEAYEAMRRECLRAARDLHWEAEEERLLQFWQNVL